MKYNWLKLTYWTSIVLLLAACNQVDALTLSEETPLQPAATLSIENTQPQDSQTNDAQMTPPTSPSRIESLIEKAKEDLAKRLSINVTEISLLEAREVVWPDASLGCPQPDMVYTQVQVDGLLIRLGVGKEMYFYHSGGNTEPFLCESISQILPKSTPKYDEFVPPPDSEID